jgi:hypothetical protein
VSATDLLGDTSPLAIAMREAWAEVLGGTPTPWTPGTDWPHPDRDTRDRFHAAWTRRALERCGIDPRVTTTQASARERGAAEREARDAEVPPPDGPIPLGVGGRGTAARSLPLEERVVRLSRQGFALATIARTSRVNESTARRYLRRHLGERIHAGADPAALAIAFHRSVAWVTDCAADFAPASETEYATRLRQRTERIARMKAGGTPSRLIATAIGLTRQRVDQILAAERRRAA